VPRPAADADRALLGGFGQTTVVPRGEMFKITSEPARLKAWV